MTPQELRNSILQLAIQGKLVEQRPEEGTATTLLSAINVERKRQTQAKKIKINKKIEPISGENIPFDIPDTWEWIRFGHLVNYAMGKTPPRAEEKWWGSECPWVSISDMPESGHVTHTKESVTKSAVFEKFGGRTSKAGTLLMSFKLTVGRVSILDIEAVHNEAIISIYPFLDEDNIVQQYLFIILPYVTQFGDSKNAIKGKTLNDTSISNLLIPLPPLAEQKRIVTKIEELLSYVDHYEQAWIRLEQFNKQFPVDMQKSILHMAIQGKLTEQRPEEGTAEELYQQIQEEKQQLIKEGKIKKEKPLPEVAQDEVPFDIPENWKWVRIGEIFSVIRGSSPRPKGSPIYWSKENTGLNWITIKDISTNVKNKRLLQTQEHLTVKGAELSTFVEQEELIIAVSGSTTGKHCLLGIDGYIYDGLAAILNPTKMVYSSYIFYFFDWVYKRLNAQKIGSAFPNINTDVLKRTLFPLPPLAEQKRIVARLEELLPLCERLK